jgi:hypothetical protein
VEKARIKPDMRFSRVSLSDKVSYAFANHVIAYWNIRSGSQLETAFVKSPLLDGDLR